jgi:hypothetical protein
MNPKYIYPIIFFILFSCTNNKEETESQTLPLINLDESKPNVDTFEFESIQYIPLETKDDCLIGDISKIIYQNKDLVIVKKVTNFYL